MDLPTVQQSFFQHIKSTLPLHISMVDEIAEVLNISNDSAYRRIRGEKAITMDEISKLATHFKISLDQLLHLKGDSFIFTGKLADTSEKIFERWLENSLQQLSYVATFKDRHLYFLTKDIPLFYHFQIPELAAFKNFFWMKSILHYDALRGKKFSVNDINEEHLKIGKKIIEAYNKTPTTEIWNLESVNSTIRQIQFYAHANNFATPGDLSCIFEKLVDLMNHIEKQAEQGVKFLIGETPKNNAATYNLYNNELILGDNTVLTELDGKKLTFLNHSVINYISTTNEAFNDQMFGSIQNLIKKSSYLSVVGEKERTRFFNRIRNKIVSSSKQST